MFLFNGPFRSLRLPLSLPLSKVLTMGPMSNFRFMLHFRYALLYIYAMNVPERLHVSQRLGNAAAFRR